MSTLLLVLVLAAPQDREGLDFFEQRIRPLLADRCYGCHSARAAKLKGGLRLDRREAVLKGGDGGPVLVPGDPDRSRLVRAVRRLDDDLAMPPKEALSAQQVSDLETWIRMGAPASADYVPATAGKPVTLAAEALSKAARHWAFQPPREPPPPQVKETGWVRTPVDPFILAKLEENGLRPSPATDKRTLLRRVTFDLLGLPPSPEEVESFESDERPDAYARAVDRLLASPHYGERWGRYWLDVARYADTKGYTFREERRFFHSHLYRDWVIRSFNEDLPFDRFLMLQIAADQLVGEGDRRDLAAAGFLTVGQRFTKVLYEIIDDRIDVLTRGILGLTVTCARCHDHKYDPIPTQDYYSLYGILAGSTEKTVACGPRDSAFENEYRARGEKLERAFSEKRKALLQRLREQVELYLVAVLEADRLPGDNFFQMLGPEAVNPVIVRQWESYLYRTRKDAHPVLAVWHALAEVPERELAVRTPELLRELAGRANPRVIAAFESRPPESMRDVARTYGRLLAGAARAAQASDPSDEEVRQVLYGSDSPVRVPEGCGIETERFFDDDTRNALCGLQTDLERWLVQSSGSASPMVILGDKSVQETQRVFRRGNPTNLGEEAPPRFLAALSFGPPTPFRTGSGRLELARAVASPENPLTARVFVNRVWMHHFGEGLVRTPSDFGARGEPPTHPDLLDFLAVRFMEGGWSLKKLHRLIMLSNTYRQSSRENPEARALDPDNRLLWRMNRRRLDFEAMRDSLLAVSGRLDPTVGGRGVDLSLRPSPPRRSVYGYVDRLNLPGMHRAFDFASPDTHTAQRHETTTPQQSLFLLNSPFLLEQARRLIERPELPSEKDVAARLAHLYRIVYGRSPSAAERTAGLDFFAASQPESANEKTTAWRYGLGEYDAIAGRVTDFRPMPYFTGTDWQPHPQPPDPEGTEARLGAQGGRPPAKGVLVLRWTAPVGGIVTVRGTLEHKAKEGDGVRGRVAHSREGETGSWTVPSTRAETPLEGLRVEAGDTLDFVVDGRGDARQDAFTWAPVITLAGGRSWNSASEFRGPRPGPPGAWERYVQVLVLANEFVFVD